MTTMQLLEQAAEVKICTCSLKLDKHHEIQLNVKLVSFDEWQKTVNALALTPETAIPELFLDPNTGEKLFTPEKVKKLTKFMVEKLIDLFIKTNLAKEDDQNG